jgi:uncharacterized membrane protein YeaQ/YmgE (transglycosylase-associated protein family)
VKRLNAEHREQSFRHRNRRHPFGLIAGLLASTVVGGIGYGLVGDIVVGVVGAVFGGWIFASLDISVPIQGLPGTILVAFVGAVVLLLAIRLLRPGQRLAR